MLKLWLAQGDTTWNAIVQVLRNNTVQRPDVAYELEQVLLD